MNDKELKKKCLERYLGKIEEDDILEIATEWYSNIITNKDNIIINKDKYENIVFITDRSYMLASALEMVSGRSMESESSAKIFTASSFCSYYEQLAQWYVEHHQFPTTLLCEDVLYYENNIRMITDNLLKNVLKILRKFFSEDADIERIKQKFYLSMNVSFIASSGYGLSDFMFSDRVVDTNLNKNMRKINDLSNRLSNCVKFMNFSNDTYNCYEVIQKEKLSLLNLNDFIQTIYENKIEFTRIETICIDNRLKAILSLRIVQNDLSEDSICIIPFVFLPNLSKKETEDIWNGVKGDIINNEDQISQEFATHMDYLKELDGKCLFNEYLTLIFNYALLDDFNQENGIDFTHTDLYQQQLKILSRNYNITDSNKTKKYLDSIFKKRYLKKEKLCQLLQSKICEEKEICCINEYGSDVTLNNLEEYWYSLAMDRDRVYRCFNTPCITKSNGLCFTLASIFAHHNMESIKLGISNFLQLVDANIVDISCLATSNIEVTGYAQFVSLGDMSSFIYPNMLKEYIPTFLKMHRIFYDILYRDFNASRGEKDWWIEFVTEFFRNYSSYADSPTIEKMKFFLQKFDVEKWKPDIRKWKFDDWNIDWKNNVNRFNEKMVTSEAIMIGNQLEYLLTRNRCLREFEDFCNDEIWIFRDDVKKKMKILEKKKR